MTLSMKILRIIGLLTGLIWLASLPALATDEDDPELGIQMKKGARSLSVSQALGRATRKTTAYNKAKKDLIEGFTGPPKTGSGHPQGPKLPGLSWTLKKERKPLAGAKIIRLKSGQTLTGVVTKKDKNGAWIEAEEGASVYVRNDERAS